MNQTYRWNQAEHAAGYDAAVEIIHPYYAEIQQAVLDQIARPRDAAFLLVDLGGGSGRLVEKFLARFPNATAILVDQSEPFLDLAKARLEPFGRRASHRVARLQDDWAADLPQQPAAIVSTSAIHHLAPDEKRRLFAECYAALAPMGVFANGDEVRAADDERYKQTLIAWAAHLRDLGERGLLSAPFRRMCDKWEERNVKNFDVPRASGDDCHETIQSQLAYLCDCGFRSVSAPWQKDMWAVMLGVK